jgi:DNA mismatch repair protein MutL
LWIWLSRVQIPSVTPSFPPRVALAPLALYTPTRMNRIRLLPEHVANQIAAGEVVERPSAVVKELVENSIDADAHRITIAIKNGGRSTIRVTDDGFGMNRDDALLALERHATSKITKAEDLHRVCSLGFRGEAIPSIAAVSRFTLTTRERGALSGTEIEIAGGKILNVQDTGTAEGTVIEVRNLFFNLPARRKFLRTVPTETAHIEHIATLNALAHPEVAFQLLVDDREVFNLAPAAKLLDRLRELHGTQLCSELIPVELARGEITISGFIGKPGISRGDRSRQYIFVNRRPVESKGISFSLMEGYHTALMKGRYPVTFLFIEIAPDLVDVNIHPAKREIRFRDEFAVRQCVIDAVHAALEPVGIPQPLPVSNVVAAVPAALPFVSPSMKTAGVGTHYTLPLEGEAPAEPRVAMPPTTEIQTDEGNWRILGAIGKLYVLAESPEGLVLIDQHAAHERVLFEKMLKDLAAESAPTQKLLLPVTLELDAHDANFLRQNLKTLQKLGIGVNEFGDRTFMVDSLPPFFSLANLSQTFRDIVDELHQTGEQIHARRLGEDRIATTVCRHAVKAHDPLSGEELRALLQQLHRCDLPYTCPHGRPTMIQISYVELEKKFGRKV